MFNATHQIKFDCPWVVKEVKEKIKAAHLLGFEVRFKAYGTWVDVKNEDFWFSPYRIRFNTKASKHCWEAYAEDTGKWRVIKPMAGAYDSARVYMALKDVECNVVQANSRYVG